MFRSILVKGRGQVFFVHMLLCQSKANLIKANPHNNACSAHQKVPQLSHPSTACVSLSTVPKVWQWPLSSSSELFYWVALSQLPPEGKKVWQPPTFWNLWMPIHIYIYMLSGPYIYIYIYGCAYILYILYIYMSYNLFQSFAFSVQTCGAGGQTLRKLLSKKSSGF